MNFSTFAIIGLFIAVVGAGVVRQIVRQRKAIFDANFTELDRKLADEAAFFILLPISVALHEVGHAILVKVFGATVTGYGYFVFAGYVSYEGFLTDVQQVLIAAAGTVVNILLAGLAAGFVLLRRPPVRAAFNEVLWQFAVLSIANALIFYPLLDFATGMNGDWRQMYFGGVPWLAGVIFLVHAGILAGGYLAFKNDRFSARVSKLTGLPPHVRRGFMGGLRLAQKPTANRPPEPPSPQELIVRDAIKRVSSGWPQALHAAIARRQQGVVALIRWRKEDGDRVVSIVQERAGSVVVMLPNASALAFSSQINGRVWQRWAEFPDEDTLVLAVRLAMEEADRRPAAPIAAASD